MEMPTATKTYRAKKFPPLCTAVVQRLTEERTIKMFASWFDTMKHYGDKYEADWSEVKRLANKAHQNATRREEESKKEEENDEPTNPGQERKAPEYALWISEETLVEIEAELKASGSYSIKFDCDDYRTRFRMVDGEVLAFEPRFPQGRKVSSQARAQINLTEHTVTSTRAAIAMCLTSDPAKYAETIGAMRLVEMTAERAAVTEGDAHCRMLLFGLAGRLASQHADIIRIGFERGGVALGIYAGHEDDEIVQDIKELCKQLN
jgi:hypothetical protein